MSLSPESAVPAAIDASAVPAAENAPDMRELRRMLFLIGIGIFATTLGQMQSIGDLPVKALLKQHLGMAPTQVSAFVGLSSFAWNLKPLAGLLSDSFPIFGSRRRYYLLFSSLLAGLFWLMLGLVPKTYVSLLWTAVILNAMLVLSSTVTGGLLVEASQRYNATGRISSLRYVLLNISMIVSGPFGGYLASRAFHYTTTCAAILMLSLTLATFFFLHETRTAQRDTEALTNAWRQMRRLVRSRPLLLAGLFTFLIGIAPGFGTPLLYYSTDRLHFSMQFIGNLTAVSGVLGLLGAVLYGVLCKRMNLRSLMAIGVVLGGVSALLYLWYRQPLSALIISGAAGLTGTLAVLPQFDLAARATPKGCEALGYSLLMSVANIAMSLSDYSGSWLYDHWHMTFRNLIWLNAGTTLIVLLAIPILPAALMSRHDGEEGEAGGA